jgi:hypothetical protein
MELFPDDIISMMMRPEAKFVGLIKVLPESHMPQGDPDGRWPGPSRPFGAANLCSRLISAESHRNLPRSRKCASPQRHLARQSTSYLEHGSRVLVFLDMIIGFSYS